MEAVWGVPRKAMTVGISGDGGKTWKGRVLQEGNGFCLTNNSERRERRELSYPSICVERGEGVKGEEIVNVAFTFWRQRIRFCRFAVGWVEG
ncbi:hypothetical protein BCR34DRAFT_580413 [Clohesyomyces aquaticus]|uniref:Uncharacterized protein n=1 Tax=Clohesyomyces aquaticus TaxID=1231657 RepID=A0A1Y1Y6G8_9PLEO|nr:hypothetical protein BCR34DRAFT_580413 [Clohesyomyces aquaticus]